MDRDSQREKEGIKSVQSSEIGYQREGTIEPGF